MNHRIDSYNTKLISSCLKQILTLTLGLVTPTVTITLEEADGVEEALVIKVTLDEEIAEIVEITSLLNRRLSEK